MYGIVSTKRESSAYIITFLLCNRNVTLALKCMATSNKKTYTTPWGGNRLSIYDPDGNKIHAVGNLMKLWGTALDPRDGSVFIAKYSADTVLKYCV